MNDHLSQIQLADFKGGKLAPGELLDVDDHLAACAACRGRLEEGAREVATGARADLVIAAGEELDHLTEEQVSLYVSGKADEIEREVIASHLEVCEPCSAEVLELRRFAESAGVSTSRQRWWEAIGSLLWIRAVAVAAVAIAVAMIVWYAMGSSGPAERNEIVNGNANENSRPVIVETNRPDNVNESLPEQPGSVVALDDGAGRIGVRKDGTLEGLERLSTAEQAVIARAMTTGTMPVANTSDVAVRRGEQMGTDGPAGTLAPSYPIGRVVVADKPVFRWKGIDGATEYRVEVFDPDSNRVADSGPLHGTTWTPQSALPGGKVLSWQIVAVTPAGRVTAPAPPAAPARFRVLTPREAAAVRDGVARANGSHLAAAIVYAQAGLVDDAERELRALQAANKDSETARRLLASLRARR